MYPPDCFTIPYTVASPSPVPLPVGLVVKNGSKSRAIVALSMPHPVSVTASSTYRPGATLSWLGAYAASSSTSAVSIVSAAAPRHRVAGVDGEVREDLLDLARVGLDAARVGARAGTPARCPRRSAGRASARDSAAAR